MGIQAGQVYCNKYTKRGDETIMFTEINAVDAVYKYTTYKFSPYVCYRNFDKQHVDKFIMYHCDDFVFDSLQSFANEFDLDMDEINEATYAI